MQSYCKVSRVFISCLYASCRKKQNTQQDSKTLRATTASDKSDTSISVGNWEEAVNPPLSPPQGNWRDLVFLFLFYQVNMIFWTPCGIFFFLKRNTHQINIKIKKKEETKQKKERRKIQWKFSKINNMRRKAPAIRQTRGKPTVITGLLVPRALVSFGHMVHS